MAMLVASATTIPPRRELALILAGDAIAPLKVMTIYFNRVIEEMERKYSYTFDVDLKGKAWNKIPTGTLNSLKETLIDAFCKQILSGFNDTEINIMLEEFKMINVIRNIQLHNQLEAALKIKGEKVTEAVMDKGKEILKGLPETIFQLLIAEGIFAA